MMASDMRTAAFHASDGEAELESWLTVELGLRLRAHEALERRHLDSFDWRMWRAGLRFVHEAVPAGGRLSLTQADDHRLLGRAEGELPSFVEDLPLGSPLRSRVAQVVENRRLFSWREAPFERWHFERLDGRGKRRASVYIERVRGREGARLRIEPVRGYETESRNLARALEVRLGPPIPDEAFEQAVVAAGRELGDRGAKQPLRAQHEEPSLAVLQRILSAQWAVMRENEEGVVASSDVEFLHDYRVAIRRSRAALSQLGRDATPGVFQPFAAGLKWLGTVTSPVRDSDVLGEDLASLVAVLPASLAEGAERLAQLVGREGERAQAKLAVELRGTGYRHFCERYERFLDQDFESWERRRRPFSKVAARRISRLRQGLLEDGGSIRSSSPAEALHELRKEGKKLRYVLMFSRELLPKELAKAAISGLKALQNVLGEHQDYEVQAEAFAALGKRLSAGSEGVSGDALGVMAAGALVEECDRRQRGAREFFAERFEAFASKDSRRLYASIHEELTRDRRARSKS